MAGPNLGILIPAFNEEKTVSIVINEAKKFGDVILSDDNSTDNTKEISLQAGALVIDNVFEKGYRYHDKVVRHAKVIVNKK